MKACGEVELQLCSSWTSAVIWKWVVSFTAPVVLLPLLLVYEAGLVSQSVWTLFKKIQNLLPLPEIATRFLGHVAPSLITIDYATPTPSCSVYCVLWVLFLKSTVKELVYKPDLSPSVSAAARNVHFHYVSPYHDFSYPSLVQTFVTNYACRFWMWGTYSLFTVSFRYGLTSWQFSRLLKFLFLL